MKNKFSCLPGFIVPFQTTCWWLLAPICLCLLCRTAPGQIFVANVTTGKIGIYSPTGEPLNTNLVTGLGKPEGIAVDGNGYLYVACDSSGTISKFTTDGAVVNRP